MDMFARIYAAQVGNLALNTLPYGGLYIAGGIAAKNQTLIQSKNFLEAFQAKGRMRDRVSDIPLHLIINTETGLIGASNIALQRI